MTNKQEKAQSEATRVENELNAAYQLAFNDYLCPFADLFSRIKNVDLGELPLVEVVPEMRMMDVEVRGLGVNAVQGLAAMAGGGAVGAAAGGMTFAAVGAFATASTGAAISGLSGAAATSATLAWLGGGSIAAGGGGVAAGGAVLAGMVAAPVVLALAGVLWWQGERAHNQQLKTRNELRQADAKLDAQIAKSEAANSRATQSATVVRNLADVACARLPQLRATVDDHDDYATFDHSERESLAELVAIATTIAAVIACPILDENGDVAASGVDATAAAQAMAERLATPVAA